MDSQYPRHKTSPQADTSPSEENSPIHLVVNADDFGYCDVVDNGILEGFEQGVVTSTSLLTTFPDRLPRSIEMLQQNPGLAVGLHLDFTWGPDAWPEQAMCNSEGCRLGSASKLLQAILSGEVDKESIRKAARIQFERFRQTGLTLSHVDTHQHVLCLKPVHDAICELAHEYGASYLRFPKECHKGFRNKSLLRFLLDVLPYRENFPVSCSTLGVVVSGQLTENNLLKIIHNLEPGAYELVCHPARGTTMCGRDKLSECREIELEALMSSKVSDAIEKKNIKLSTFPELGKGQR